MTFNEKIDIQDNIVKYCLQAKYNEELTDDETMEIETLHDYVRKIKFTDIDFTANVKMDSDTPTVTEDEVGDAVVEVSLGKVAPKEYVLDENLNIMFSIDATRINDSELNSILTTKPLVSQAKIAVFQSKIKEKITEILTEMRNEDNTFEKESETIL
ncbi:hypothetical protein C824_001441 [Schaedlerella arabinosiphila]|nr:hypothetical protein C824_001441 [Schaedlerella arabinosiphila]